MILVIPTKIRLAWLRVNEIYLYVEVMAELSTRYWGTTREHRGSKRDM